MDPGEDRSIVARFLQGEVTETITSAPEFSYPNPSAEYQYSATGSRIVFKTSEAALAVARYIEGYLNRQDINQSERLLAKKQFDTIKAAAAPSSP